MQRVCVCVVVVVVCRVSCLQSVDHLPSERSHFTRCRRSLSVLCSTVFFVFTCLRVGVSRLDYLLQFDGNDIDITIETWHVHLHSQDKAEGGGGSFPIRVKLTTRWRISFSFSLMRVACFAVVARVSLLTLDRKWKNRQCPLFLFIFFSLFLFLRFDNS